ncbi:hypothetical protein MTP03_44870 [Tsukamurella sp. PLM1]|nr:hypothetical protein MTP03_44870 [Tsukamurella sp. PLM1]
MPVTRIVSASPITAVPCQSHGRVEAGGTVELATPTMSTTPTPEPPALSLRGTAVPLDGAPLGAVVVVRNPSDSVAGSVGPVVGAAPVVGAPAVVVVPSAENVTGDAVDDESSRRVSPGPPLRPRRARRRRPRVR